MRRVNRTAIPGLSANYVQKLIKKEESMQNKTVNQDTQNRKYVIQKVNEFMQEGRSIEEAVDLIMKDDIIKEFDYWVKNNLDVRQCIINLVTSNSKNRNRKEKER